MLCDEFKYSENMGSCKKYLFWNENYIVLHMKLKYNIFRKQMFLLLFP